MKRYRRSSAGRMTPGTAVLVAILLWLVGSGAPLLADTHHDFMMFASLDATKRFSGSDPELDDYDPGAAADFLYTLNTDRVRFLAEFMWSDTESELERLQLSINSTEDTTIWLGRFHSIANYWTSEYHHGQYLQTSISRPGLEAWEDDSGPLPSHMTGINVEHRFPTRQDGRVTAAVALGLAPRLVGEEMVPFDILDPDSGHELALNGKLVFSPDFVGENQFGLLLASNKIDVDPTSSPTLADLSSIDQLSIGLIADWRWERWRLISNVTYFDIDLHYVEGTQADSFTLGYLQGEYEATDRWTIFARHEFAFSEDDSAYLGLLPEAISHRNMIGVRWDFHRTHSLSAEVARTSLQGSETMHENFDEVRIQWSTVVP